MRRDLTDHSVAENIHRIGELVEKTNNEQNGKHLSSDTEINLIAVSKTHSADQIRPALETGHLHYGENRVQEALTKWPLLKLDYPDVKLHLIGPLQTNKVKEAIGLFDVIHTLDRIKLAQSLAKEIKNQNKYVSIFVQVNTGAEDQKSGLLPGEVDPFLKEIAHLGLPIVGLMCIPPVSEEPSPHFALLKKIAQRNGLSRLSMGMSSDYETALEFGATDIRVGSAIFGSRK